MEQIEYLVELNWTWGRSSRFRECFRFHVQNKDDILKYATYELKRIARNYTYDCNHLDMPLNPVISSIAVTPVAKTEYIDTKELDNYLEVQKDKTTSLIKEGRIFINGETNYE